MVNGLHPELPFSYYTALLRGLKAMTLTPPLRMTLERAMSYIQDDELVEITPKSIRLRKRHLDPNDRKRAEKTKEALAS